MKDLTGVPSAEPISYEESLAMPESTLEEIVEGELRIMPPPKPVVQIVIQKVGTWLGTRLDRRRYTVIPGYGQGIRIRPRFTYRVPDLGIFLTETMVMKDDYYIWSPPETIIEVLSPWNRKGNLKELLEHYAIATVPEVWFLDISARLLRREFLVGDKYRAEMPAGSGTFAPMRVPEASLDLQRVWGWAAMGGQRSAEE